MILLALVDDKKSSLFKRRLFEALCTPRAEGRTLEDAHMDLGRCFDAVGYPAPRLRRKIKHRE